jgi:hypothetical protein
MLSLMSEGQDFDVKDLPDDAVIWRYMDLSKFLWLLREAVCILRASHS